MDTLSAIYCYTVDRTPPVIDPKARFWSRIAIFAYPTYIRWFDAPVRGLRQNIAIAFGVEKAEGVATRRWKKMKISLFVSIEYTNATDEQTDITWKNGIGRAYA